MSNLIPDYLMMKTKPDEIPSSARQRKSPQGSSSIYVPPPLRKRKNSIDSKKNTSTAPQKSKIVPGRGISLNLNSCPPSKCTSKSKKCENSYMLFGFEDMSNAPTKSYEKTVNPQIPEGKDNNITSLNVKKCDNSYLLFSSQQEHKKLELSNFSNKKYNEKFSRRPITSMKVESNDSQRLPIRNALPSDDICHSENETFVRIKSFESIISPYLPEELSFELNSLSDGIKSQNLGVAKHCNRETLKPIKQSSNKKCDNSSFLFEDEDDCSDYKFGKSFSKDKTGYLHNSQTYGDNEISCCLNSCVPPINIDESIKYTQSTVLPTPVESYGDLPNKGKDQELEKAERTLDAQTSPSFNADISDSIEDYVIEIFDFPKTLRTQDMMTIFSVYVQDGFFIKWVDDTHALGVFSNPFSVTDVLKKTFDLVNVRPLQSASPASVNIAATLPIPSAARPRTCPSLARRLVSGALGLRVSVSDEIRQAERKMLQEAKEERRLAAKQREEAWEGTLRSSLGT